MGKYTFSKNRISNIVKQPEVAFEQVFERSPAAIVEKIFFNSNINNFAEFVSFLDSKSSILSITGFRGTGKTFFIELAKNLFAQESLVFEHNISNSVSLDDIILNLYKNIESQCIKHQIDTLNFRHKKTYSEKVITFFKSVKIPGVIVIDNVNEIFINDKLTNYGKIFDFINFLSNFENIKIILISRNSEHTDYIKNRVEKIKMGPLEEEEYYKLLEAYELNKSAIEDFYSLSRGYLLNAQTAIEIMKTQNITVSQLMTDNNIEKLPFDEFLYKKNLTKISENNFNALKLLSVARIGFSIELLKELNILIKEGLKKNVLYEKNSSVFIHDYYSKIVFNSLSRQERNKIHSFLKDIYEKQIEINVKERKLNVSRITLHNEFDYHKTFYSAEFGETPYKQQSRDNFAYISSSAIASFDWDLKASKRNNKKSVIEDDSKPFLLNSQDIEDIEKDLSEEERLLLQTQNDENNDIVLPSSTPIQEQDENESTSDVSSSVSAIKSLQDYLNEAQSAENKFDHKTAVYKYEKALELLQPQDADKKPVILTKIAVNKEKLLNYEDAISSYKEVLAIYESKNDKIKANYILLSIANAYKAVFEYDKAFDIYENILSLDINSIPKPQTLQAYVGAADYYEYIQNSKQTINYLLKALNLAQELNDANVLSEVNFKLALFLDETGNGENALKYYNKCIEISQECSKKDYISSAYSNLATIHKEKGDYKQAILNYKQGLEIDIKSNNHDGIIYIYQKLSEIYAENNKDLALEYLHNALKCAKQTNDGYYLASSYLSLGDFYFNAKIYNKALKSYVLAKHSYGKNISSENKAKIEMRFNDVRAIVGENNYKKLLLEINK